MQNSLLINLQISRTQKTSCYSGHILSHCSFRILHMLSCYLRVLKVPAKSLLETEVKRIADPSEIELFILNKKRNDFIINLAHNYYNAYDNVKKIPQWLSNDICAATTGAGFSMRTLYTTAEETYLKFKRCFALSSIGASLTEDDALERCISIKHPKLVK